VEPRTSLGVELEKNLNRVLPGNLDAVIDPTTYRPPEVFRVIRETGSIPDNDVTRIQHGRRNGHCRQGQRDTRGCFGAASCGYRSQSDWNYRSWIGLSRLRGLYFLVTASPMSRTRSLGSSLRPRSRQAYCSSSVQLAIARINRHVPKASGKHPFQFCSRPAPHHESVSVFVIRSPSRCSKVSRIQCSRVVWFGNVKLSKISSLPSFRAT
jgi:hypothetical protein